MQITYYPSCKSSKGQPLDLTWEQFKGEISAHQICPDKLASPAFLPGKVEGPRRANHVKSICMLVYDIDSPQDVATFWGSMRTYQAYEFYVYTTYSHTQQQPKYRVIFPVEQPIKPHEFNGIWPMIDIHGKDSECRDLARLYFLPTAAKLDGTGSWYNKGDLYNPRPFKQGNRNSNLTKEVGRWFGEGVTTDRVLEYALESNRDRCKPPLPDTDVTTIVESIGKREAAKPKTPKKPAPADDLYNLALSRVRTTFNDGVEGYSLLEDKGQYRIQDQSFRNWLELEYIADTCHVPSKGALIDAIRALNAYALEHGEQKETYHRIANRGDEIWIDLADKDWQAIRVTRQGWHIYSGQVPIYFTRNTDMLPLAAPNGHEGDVGLLKGLLNVSDRDWMIVLSWLLWAYNGTGPYPLLSLVGEQGTAKTTATRLLRDTIDPHRTKTRVLPKTDRDLMITLRNNYVLALDNVSHIPDDMSDALCRVATGSGFGTRQLYTDIGEVTFEGKRPVIFNSIVDCAFRPDLLNRLLSVQLEPVKGYLRQTVIDSRLKKVSGTVLAGICDLLVESLRNPIPQDATINHRMADFVLWVSSLEGNLKWPKGAFTGLYGENRLEVDSALMDDPMIESLADWLGRYPQGWQGSLGDLYKGLRPLNPLSMSWPKSPRGMGKSLQRLSAILRERYGIIVDRKRNSLNRYLEIRRG